MKKFARLSVGAALCLLWGCGGDSPSATDVPETSLSSSSMAESSSCSIIQIVSSSSLSYSSAESSSSSQPLVELSSSSVEPSSFLKDGDYVKIGSQLWSTRNLDVDVEGSFCYENEPANCLKYGRMYTWSLAMGIDKEYDYEWYDEYGDMEKPFQGICPEGSHLPSHGEWQTLKAYIAQNPGYLKYFNNQLGGAYDYMGFFRDVGTEVTFFSSTEYDVSGTGLLYEFTWLWYIHDDMTNFGADNGHKSVGGYVRCIKGNEVVEPRSSSAVASSSSVEISSSSQRNPVLEKVAGCDEYSRENWDYLNPDVEYGCIKDSRDGRFYKTVIVGDRIWLAENLRYVSQKASWCRTEEDGECDIYGRYYSGYAVNEEPGICPDGFHVPSTKDLLDLKSYDPLQLISVDGWTQNSITAMGDNASGFTALPGGCRAGNDPDRGWVLGKFDGVGGIARFWTSTRYNGLAGHTEVTIANRTDYYGRVGFTDKLNDFGMPIRCIDD